MWPLEHLTHGQDRRSDRLRILIESASRVQVENKVRSPSAVPLEHLLRVRHIKAKAVTDKLFLNPTGLTLALGI